jgi:putative copper resistance protein D
MIWFLQDFGLLSVVLRAITLTLQTLTVGGVAYLAWMTLRGALIQTPEAERRCLVWVSRFAVSLAVAGVLYVLVDSIILVGNTGLPIAGLIGADYFLSGSGVVACALALAVLARRLPATFSRWAMPTVAIALMVCSVFTSHAVARMDHRVGLSILTLLHQGAAAVWMGGLTFLLLSLRTANITTGAAQTLLRRFTAIAVAGFTVLVSTGILLSISYVGSLPALYGTAYGVMILFKAVLLAMATFIGAINYSAARDGRFAQATLALLRRRTEIELAIFMAAILTAASLTSQPPGIDLVEGRLTATELVQHFHPVVPRLTPPSLQTLSPVTPIEESLRNPDDAERTAAHTIRDPDKDWSEFVHNWCGLFLIVIGSVACLSSFGATTPSVRWARYWPLLFFPMAIFITIVNDPENWPLGPVGFWKSFADPEVLVHRLLFMPLFLYGVFESGVQTGKLRSRGSAMVFPVMMALGAVGMLLHNHALGNTKLELLAEISHTVIGVLAMTAAALRSFQIWLSADVDRHPEWTRDNAALRLRKAAAWAGHAWPVCLIVTGFVLAMYREA